MNPEQIAKTLYGTSDPDEVRRLKTTDFQERFFASDAVNVIEMTPQECAKACKRAGVVYQEGYEGRVLGYKPTDETVDRMGDIVRSKGAEFGNYVKNPVVQFAHNYYEVPVGATLKIWYDKAGPCIRAHALFVDDRVDPSGRADLVFRFARSGIMRACSIGFQPLAWNVPEDEEEQQALGLGRYGVEYTSWDFLEFSPVPVPANPSALEESFTKAFRSQLGARLREGDFTAKDVAIVKEFPLFDQAVLDEFVKELGGATSIVPDIDFGALEVDEYEACEYDQDLEDTINEVDKWMLVDAEGKPFPNEHAARLKAPGGFDEFRRKKNGKILGGTVEVPKTVAVIWGHLTDEGDDAWAEQALRFPTKDWTADAAKTWLKDNEVKVILFEEATEGAVEELLRMELYALNANGTYDMVGITPFGINSDGSSDVIWTPSTAGIELTAEPIAPPQLPTITVSIPEIVDMVAQLHATLDTLKSDMTSMKEDVQNELRTFIAEARKALPSPDDGSAAPPDDLYQLDVTPQL